VPESKISFEKNQSIRATKTIIVNDFIHIIYRIQTFECQYASKINTN